MRDPDRLLEGGATEAELRLLRAGADERPNEVGREQLRAALGLAAVHPAAAKQAGSAARPPDLGGASAGAYASKLTLKWLVGATLGMGLMAGGLLLPRAPSRVPPGFPVQREGASAPAAAPETAESAVGTGDTLAREVALLDAARTGLAARDIAAALGACDRHALEFPRGALREEASLLRIEALLLAGQRGRAIELGEAFLRAYPASGHRVRVQALLARSRDGR